jgi:hypothetical protein
MTLSVEEMVYILILVFVWGMGVGTFLMNVKWKSEIRYNAKMGIGMYVKDSVYYAVHESEMVEYIRGRWGDK